MVSLFAAPLFAASVLAHSASSHPYPCPDTIPVALRRTAVAASVEVAASCSCRLLTHQTLLWHHRLGHPSLPRLRGMHSCLLVSGLPRSLPPLPRSIAPPCLPCVDGRQCAAPHSSFPPTTAPLQTLHMDVARFQQDLSVLRLHSERGGEFSSGLLEDFCGVEGIRQTFTLLESPQPNAIAKRRIGLVMEVARTSIVHAAAPHFLWPFAVRYTTEQLKLWPNVSHLETSPTLRWTGEVGDASSSRVWGALLLVRGPPARNLSPRTLRCVFLGFPTDALGWWFYHTGSRRVLSSQDVTFDESVCFYRLHPHRSSPVPLPPLALVSEPPPVAPLPPQGPAPSAEGGDPTPATTVTPRRSARLAVPLGFPPRYSSPPLQPVAVDSGAAGGGTTGGAGSRCAECPLGTGGTGGTSAGGPASRLRAGGAGTARAGGAGTGGAFHARTTRAGGAGTPGAAGGTGGATAVGASVGSPGSRRKESLSPERLHDASAGVPGTGGTGAAAGTGGAGAAGGTGGAGPGGASAGVPGVGRAGGTGTGGGADTGGTTGGTIGAGGTGYGGAVDTRAGGSGGATTQPQPSVLRHLLNLPPAATEFSVAGTTPPLLFPPTDQSQPQLLPGSSLPAPAPHNEVTASLTARCEPETRASSLERREPETRASVPARRVVMPSPPASSLPHVLDPESDLIRAASPTATCLLATVVTDPSFESAAASALVDELVDFEALCRLDYAASLVFNHPVLHPSGSAAASALVDELVDFDALCRLDYAASLFGLECLAAVAPYLASTLLCPEGDPDALDILTPRTYAEAITGPYSSQWQITMDAKMASWKSKGTYVDEVPSLGAKIVDGMWIFRVKRPSGSPPAFKARYVARGFSHREGVNFFQTFSPTPKMTTLRVLLYVAAQRDYKLHSLNFSTAFLQGSLHEAICLRRPVHGQRQAPREWHDTLAALGFAPSTADPSMFLRTDTSLLPFYVLVYVDDLVFATADTEALALVKAELQERHTCTDMGPLAFRLHVVLITTHPSVCRPLALSSTFGRVLHRAWGSYLEDWVQLFSPVTKTLLWLTTRRLTGRHRGTVSASALLQQRGQLCLAYVATRANTANVFTKALGSSDHHGFCIVLGLVPTLPHLLGCPIQFDTWLDDLQLYLLSDSRDSVLLFDHTSGASLAPPTTADSATRSQWLTRHAAARLVVRNHLPLAERSHFGQHKTAKSMYDAVVARYSSPPTGALGRLLLPYLFSELFSLGSGVVSWRSTRSSSVSTSTAEAEIYAGAMAA
ncbi:unnamed protein product [Closterium sp. NIES-53]